VAAPFWTEGSTNVFRHGYTYSGHPAACAVALANLDVLEREGLLERVRELEPVVERIMKRLASHSLVGEVRSGLGLLAAVEVRADALADRADLVPSLVREARDRGVLTRGLQGRALQFSPPFVITEAEIERIADVFAEALDALA
jgi:adenosylmethionine-8-amino-7-oxononanoate aminotransferase